MNFRLRSVVLNWVFRAKGTSVVYFYGCYSIFLVELRRDISQGEPVKPPQCAVSHLNVYCIPSHSVCINFIFIAVKIWNFKYVLMLRQMVCISSYKLNNKISFEIFKPFYMLKLSLMS